VERRASAREVRKAVHDLPPDQRQVIELAYFGGFTHRQIAEMLELPAGTVKGRMRLGLAKLRLALGDPAAVVL
jgi:RNA polymerase sigma-70 factor (ECF subfamily)